MDILDKIQNVESTPAGPMTALFYGHTKHGKTHILSTFPGPMLVMSVGPERSSRPTLKATGRDDIDIINIVSVDGNPAGENNVSMQNMIDRAEEIQIARGYKTWALDTSSQYFHLFISEKREYGNRRATFDVWDKFYEHLKNMRNRFHNLGTHFVWTCHVRYERDGESISRMVPDIPGQKTLQMLLGSCNIVGYLDVTEREIKIGEGENQSTKREDVYWLRLKCPYDWMGTPFEAGSHFKDRLKKPAYAPNFKTLVKYLNTDDGPHLVTE